jgi:signal transduction histidine kinase
MREELQRSAPVPVELRFSLAEDLPEIRADMAEVREVVWNLAANAVDAVAGTKGIVEIATAVCEISAGDLREVAEDEELSPGKYVRLAVVDNGCGMTAEVAQNAFEPFFTTKFTGRGLGLSAVQGIVRAHRGAIRVHTGVGSGTKVEVLFPSGEPEE